MQHLKLILCAVTIASVAVPVSTAVSPVEPASDVPCVEYDMIRGDIVLLDIYDEETAQWVPLGDDGEAPIVVTGSRRDTVVCIPDI